MVEHHSLGGVGAIPAWIVGGLLMSGAASAVASQATLTLDKRIGPIALKESKAHVTAALGRGVTVHYDHQKWILYKRARLYVIYSPGSGDKDRFAFAIATRAARYRTRSAVGVGTSLRHLKKAVSVQCVPYDPIECQHGYLQNKPGTSFFVSVTTHGIISIILTFGH